MSGLGQSVFEDGREDGREQGREEGREQGIEEGREQGIQALVLDNLEEQVSKERILQKIQKHFCLPAEKAEYYYERFAQEGR